MQDLPVGLAAIPVVGGSLVEALSLVLSPALARRKDDWLKEMAEIVESIQAQISDSHPERLFANEAFITATMQATRIALGTHQSEKRRMLRNALIKIGTGQAPNDDRTAIYLRWIEEFTPSHVRALSFFWKGANQLIASGVNIQGVRSFQARIVYIYPEFQRDTGFLNQIVTELRSRGLTTLTDISHGFPQQVITNQGIDFLNFVLDPETPPHTVA
jgi:hypothetical protein